ncbi:Bis(5'-nucleosyl)-tetraphosphatase [symmetrical] [Pseudoalteromonas holothuriae]|uniref:bis(5'-nucleosyl)-tetraphosphatase (symmetrical) n=1 Tax=Pseudoalteromonas holothuriae TaxID=2963714 RepID=A0ABN8UP29_9GAMM|nr:symmetrical bis(5'-nucleosyl)-tetraphosphatase [Pseudoalteromonas sp. CIP111951]CAH9064324.1 Bis(5'-nucleosyl)-tetraphosphatase [symmetrical] [Pseudoalteromonas sp. CIP111951]
MAQYAIGDLQGCYKPFMQLLDIVDFNPSQDHLYLVGDIVARGPDSQACLDFLCVNQNAITITLGNHDLHFLACAYLSKAPNAKDKLEGVFASKKLPQYISMLQSQPLAIFLPKLDTFISHAGIHPNWSIQQALQLADFAKQCYQSKNSMNFFANMYGQCPNGELNELSQFDKFKTIVNVFTRMRFVDKDNQLDLRHKGPAESSDSLKPWFADKRFAQDTTRYVFGHWAALEGKTNLKNVIALDTGCVWGGPMTLMDLTSGEHFSCK